VAELVLENFPRDYTDATKTKSCCRKVAAEEDDNDCQKMSLAPGTSYLNGISNSDVAVTEDQ
jgi:hypothetical protein